MLLNLKTTQSIKTNTSSNPQIKNNEKTQTKSVFSTRDILLAIGFSTTTAMITMTSKKHLKSIYRPISLICFFYLQSSYTSTAESTNKNCQTNCISPFGTKLGESSFTAAYSNCISHCMSTNPNYITYKNEEIYTGIQWQCVEYARRWLIQNKGFTFDSVDYAYDIWSLTSAHHVPDGHEIPFLKFEPGKSHRPPKVGDLLVYSKDFRKLNTGHVAVVTGVSKNHIEIAEENLSNTAWESKNYSRKIDLIKDKQGFYSLDDTDILGWMRIKE